MSNVNNTELEKAGGSTGVMVAFMIPEDIGRIIYDSVAPALNEAEIAPLLPSTYHITLAFMGDMLSTSGHMKPVIDDVLMRYMESVQDRGFFDATISGVGRFNARFGAEVEPIYASVDAWFMPGFRQGMVDALQVAGFWPDFSHGFTPHITLAYAPVDKPTPNLRVPAIGMMFDGIVLEWGDVRTRFVIQRDNLELSIPGKALMKSVELDNGEIVLPFLGIPYGGLVKGIDGNGRDLGGDFFDKDTNIGPLQLVLSHFDHGRDQQWLPNELKAKGFGRGLIGVAQRGETTDEGIIYNIIIDRAHKYKNMMRQLYDDGVLYASTEADYRVNDKSIPGRIMEWPVKAVDITVSPMNLLAAPVRERAETLLKSMVLETDMGNKVIKKDDAPENPTTPPVPDAPVETPAADQNGSGETEKAVSVTDKVKAAFEKSVPVDEPTPTETVHGDETAALLKSMAGDLTLLKGQIADLQEAIPELAAGIAKYLSGEVGDTQKSTLEKSAEADARKIIQSKATNRSNNNPNAPKAGQLPSSAPGKS